VHDPVLLFLDEPTAGVDVELREELWSYVERLRDRGTTVVLTTHYIEEAEKLADRIGFLRRGKLLRVDDRETLLSAAGEQHAEITLLTDAAEAVVEALGMPGLSATASNRLRLALSHPAALNELLVALTGRGVRIGGVETRTQSLEDIFRSIMAEEQ